MADTKTRLVKVVPKQPRTISGILEYPDKIDKEMELELNEKEIIRCMQYGNVYENDKPITPIDILENFGDEEEDAAEESKEEITGQENVVNDAEPESVPVPESQEPVTEDNSEVLPDQE